MITWLILVPLLGAITLYIARGFNARAISLTFNAVTAFYAIIMWHRFDSHLGGLQLVERHDWAREYVEAGAYGTRAIPISTTAEIVQRLEGNGIAKVPLAV